MDRQFFGAAWISNDRIFAFSPAWRFARLVFFVIGKTHRTLDKKKQPPETRKLFVKTPRRQMSISALGCANNIFMLCI